MPFRRFISHLLAALLLAFFWLNPLGAEEAWLVKAEQDLKSWQSQLKKWQSDFPAIEDIEALQSEVLQLKDRLDNCVQDLTTQSSLEQEKLDALGEETSNDSGQIKQRRKKLSATKQAIDTDLAVCKVSSLGIRDLIENFKPIKNRILSSTLSHRNEPITRSFTTLMFTRKFFAEDFQLHLNYWPASLVALIAWLILFPLSKYGAYLINTRLLPQNLTTPPGDYVIIMSMIAKRLPWIATLSSLILLTYLGENIILSAILLATTTSMLLAPLLEWILCHDIQKCRAGLPARALMDIVFIGVAVYFAGLKQVLDENLYIVVIAAYYALLLSFSMWLMLLLSKRENFQILNSLRIPVAVAMISGPLAMWLGYHALASLLVPGVYGTLGGFLIVYGLLNASHQFWGMFEPDNPQTNKKLRKYLGYKQDELIQGLWIGRLVVIVMVLSSFFYWLAYAWRIPDSEVEIILSYLGEGFEFGSITIVPTKILMAIVALFFLLTLARWLKNQLSNRWLNRTRLDAGAKESIVSLTSYVIVGISILIALSMAGVDFQNIAIVAGALSVGIGFGLQNIVNNFVSGLILLFERPVKPGDWVMVGATEGHVRKISIRYTLIQTFDRAEVLVPNSELISSQVTNWMLQDRMGRVIAPVGVAYGTDTELVEKLLLEVGNSNSEVLTNDWRVPPPKVLFMGFGESPLDFELRCFVREVDNRLNVRSQLLFAIDKAFRENNIEIPFPQRVVHMLNEADTVKDKPHSPASDNLNDKPAI